MNIICPKCGTKKQISKRSKPERLYRCSKCGTKFDRKGKSPGTAPESRIVAEKGARHVAEKAKASCGRVRSLLPIVHPMLFAIFPVLALYSANAAEVTPSETTLPLVATLGFALLLILFFLLLTALVRQLLRSTTVRKQAKARLPSIWNVHKATLISSVFIALFFSYGHVLIWAGGWDTVHRTVKPTALWAWVSLGWLFLFLVAAYLIFRTRRDINRLTIPLNVIAGFMVIVATFNIVINETGSSEPATGTVNVSASTAPVSLQGEALPDIYYIILDRYASASTLKDLYSYDNSEFMDHLATKGFFIASETVANYNYTLRSLRSSLNMNYIHKEAAEGQVSGDLLDYGVWHFLKTMGYRFVHFGSYYEPTRENPYADMNINYYAMPEFSWFLFQTTWAYTTCVHFNIVDEWWEAQYKRVLYKFDKLAEIPDLEGPTYVFAHMLLPHPPFVFDSAGEFQSAEKIQDKVYETYGKFYEAMYLEQLTATNTMLKQLIEKIVAKSEVPPIIILQADEGPKREYITSHSSWSITKAGDVELREKMRILNAYYLPGIDQGVLYPSISPVNSFRVVFNSYFGTDFELLPDKSYIHSSSSGYVDVTPRVKYD